MKSIINSEIQPRLWNRNYTKVWISNFMIFFSFMLLMPLLPLYLNDTFGADKELIGNVLAGYTLTALIARMFSGYIVDSFPRKKVLIIFYTLFAAFFASYLLVGSLIFFAIVRTLHGAPFGATTVANSTVAIDVLHPQRRAEGIGYYGLSNNIATAISPSIAIFIYEICQSYDAIFLLSFVMASIGVVINSTIKISNNEIVMKREPITLRRIYLLKGVPEGLNLICFAFSYGVLSTYIAIYGKEELNIMGGTGLFFLLLSLGLICARLHGSRALRQGRVVQSATLGIVISLIGYFIFAAIHNSLGYYGAALIIGFGNGHMFPAFQTMFVNLAKDNQRGTANASQLTSWDIGIGCGVLIGGYLAENYGYHWAFWAAWGVNLVGVITFFLYTRKSYTHNKLR